MVYASIIIQNARARQIFHNKVRSVLHLQNIVSFLIMFASVPGLRNDEVDTEYRFVMPKVWNLKL